MTAPSNSLPLEVSVRDAHRETGEGVALVDIRTEQELQIGVPSGSVYMTAEEIKARARQQPGWKANLICAGGARSLVLAASLRRQGAASVRSVAGGFDRWKAEGLPAELPSGLDPAQVDRYARHLVMPQVGSEGQAKLLRSRVLLAGLGGLNSPAALYLAAAGVGTLGLVDFDRVDRSNLQRQILHGEGDVGEAKSLSAQRRLRDLNPDVHTEIIDQRIDRNNAAFLVSDWDVIVDGTDNFPARYALNEACVEAGKPLVYGAVMRFQGQVSVFWPAAGGQPCMNCLLPESTTQTAPPSCAEAGVLGVMPGVIGTLQATEALKILLGVGEPLTGQLLMIDALTMAFRKTRIRQVADCPVCA